MNRVRCIDRTCTLAKPHPYAGEFIWTPEANRFGWTSLLGQEPGGPDISTWMKAEEGNSLKEKKYISFD